MDRYKYSLRLWLANHISAHQAKYGKVTFNRKKTTNYSYNMTDKQCILPSRLFLKHTRDFIQCGSMCKWHVERFSRVTSNSLQTSAHGKSIWSSTGLSNSAEYAGLVEQVRMYYGPGKGVHNSCNSWLLQLLCALTLYALQSLHANLFYL